MRDARIYLSEFVDHVLECFLVRIKVEHVHRVNLHIVVGQEVVFWRETFIKKIWYSISITILIKTF